MVREKGVREEGKPYEVPKHVLSGTFQSFFEATL